MKLIPWNNWSLIKCLPMDNVAGLRVSNVMIYAWQKSELSSLLISTLGDLLSLSLASLWNLCCLHFAKSSEMLLLNVATIAPIHCTFYSIQYPRYMPSPYILSLPVCLLYIFSFSMRVSSFFRTYSSQWIRLMWMNNSKTNQDIKIKKALRDLRGALRKPSLQLRQYGGWKPLCNSWS